MIVYSALFLIFTGRIITAAYVPVINYHNLFPETIGASTLLAPSRKAAVWFRNVQQYFVIGYYKNAFQSVVSWFFIFRCVCFFYFFFIMHCFEASRYFHLFLLILLLNFFSPPIIFFDRTLTSIIQYKVIMKMIFFFFTII